MLNSSTAICSRACCSDQIASESSARTEELRAGVAKLAIIDAALGGDVGRAPARAFNRNRGPRL